MWIGLGNYEIENFFYFKTMIKARIFAIILCAGAFCFAQQSVNKSSKSTNILVSGLPAQYTSLRIDTLSRCIQNLPDTSSVVATADGRNEYLKNISGAGKNDYVKIWTGKVNLVYQWKYKLNYLLIPQGGLETGAPVFHEAEGTTPVSEIIEGDPQEGDFFANSKSPGAGSRSYYFNSQDAAQKSAARRAKQRITELKGLECRK
jgi:hypothetical protein